MRWNVGDWAVTRIEMEFTEEVSVKDSGFDLSKLKKEQRYSGNTDDNIYHNKAQGLAIGTGEDGIQTIIFFPPKSESTRLCEGSAMAREFYSRKSWFTKNLENRFVCQLLNLPASVQDLVLSGTGVETTLNRKIAVSTIAVDPENDVLTYVYTVSAGHIVGNGAKVVWDLTGINRGEYTITVGVDDGTGVAGRTVTKVVTVK
jgi:hypothetical protein